MANKFVVLFGNGERWWAPGTSMEHLALRLLLEDRHLLASWARNSGCHVRNAVHVRVVEIEEKKSPGKGQVSAGFFERPWVRLVPSQELPPTPSHLRRHTTELELVAST